ncbi:MAG: dephospho-CoA kinase, partial [Rhodospirillaceae bacterium]|nr:dephospho-CoA kinase [Rhodospirillaceae bacterium]
MPRLSHRRARRTGPVIVGLTGSIAMGKSTAAAMLQSLGVPVFDSDAESRAVTAKGGAALPAIAARFPGVVANGLLDRAALAQKVFNNTPELRA